MYFENAMCIPLRNNVGTYTILKQEHMYQHSSIHHPSSSRWFRIYVQYYTCGFLRRIQKNLYIFFPMLITSKAVSFTPEWVSLKVWLIFWRVMCWDISINCFQYTCNNCEEIKMLRQKSELLCSYEISDLIITFTNEHLMTSTKHLIPATFSIRFLQWSLFLCI